MSKSLAAHKLCQTTYIVLLLQAALSALFDEDGGRRRTYVAYPAVIRRATATAAATVLHVFV